MHERKVRLKARRLRSLGASLNSIAVRLQIAKSTASLWLRDSKLTEKQRAKLSRQQYTQSVSAARAGALKRTQRWQREAEVLWRKYKKEPLFLLGIGLYWGEGARTQKYLSLSNNDPGLARVWLRWCSHYLPRGLKQHVRILAHADVDSFRARRYWARITRHAIVKHVTRLPTRGHGKPKKIAPYGTVEMRLGKGSAEWSTKMLVWIKYAQAVFPRHIAS